MASTVAYSPPQIWTLVRVLPTPDGVKLVGAPKASVLSLGHWADRLPAPILDTSSAIVQRKKVLMSGRNEVIDAQMMGCVAKRRNSRSPE
jgi:hypothetical protein